MPRECSLGPRQKKKGSCHGLPFLPKPDRNWKAASRSKIAGGLKTRAVSSLATSGQSDARRSHAFSVLLGVLELFLCPHPAIDLLDGRVYPHRKGSYVHSEGSVNFTIIQILICTRIGARHSARQWGEGTIEINKI